MNRKASLNRTVASAAGFAIFLVLFVLLLDLLNGQAVNPVGPVVSGLLGGVVYGAITYLLLRRRAAPQG